MSDNINHPKHYNQGKIEVIEFIEDKELNFHLANSVKYIARAGKKDPNKHIEDLEKAAWYLQRHIHNLKAEKGIKEHKRPNEMNTEVKKEKAQQELGPIDWNLRLFVYKADLYSFLKKFKESNGRPINGNLRVCTHASNEVQILDIHTDLSEIESRDNNVLWLSRD